MDKKYIVLIVFLFILIPLTSAQVCLNSAEDYAVEVVVPDYSLFSLRRIADTSSHGHTLPSEYDLRVLTIIKETINPSGLSIKLQIPTKLTETERTLTSIVSSSSTGYLKETNFQSFSGWTISCSENLCTFSKNDKKIIVRKFGDQQEVTLEIEEELESCTQTCSGVCFSTATSSKCIPSSTKREFNTILQYFGITKNFEDLLDSYRIIGSGEITVTNIEPLLNPYINWPEAVRQELVFLNNKEVISLKRNDIESIVFLSKKGQAGQNYRIVYDYNSKRWNYYDKTKSPVFTEKRDCTEYPLPEPKKALSPPSPFYLIPLIIFVSGLLILLLLIIIAKAIRGQTKSLE